MHKRLTCNIKIHAYIRDLPATKNSRIHKEEIYEKENNPTAIPYDLRCHDCQYTVPDLCSRFQFRNTPVRFRRSGNMTSQIYSQIGALSDCKPAVFNGKATWYASNPLTAKTDGIITYATPFTVFRVKPGKLSAIQKIQPTPIKSQAPQPTTVSVHTASQTVKKYTDLIHL